MNTCPVTVLCAQHSMPNPRIISHQVCWEWSTGGKQSRSAAVVAVSIDGRDVLDLLEPVHFLLRELKEKQLI